MRVTQSMLSNNMLRNLSSSYQKLGKLQNQLNSQKKITKPSDDPVVAMLGLGYRSELNRVQQYNRNISEVKNWVDTTDDAIGHGVKVIQRIRELVVQGSNGTLESSQRQAIGVEVEQLKNQLVTISNTQIGGKYIFNGIKTNDRPDGKFEELSPEEGFINLEIFEGITMPVNVKGSDLFGNMLEEDGSIQQLVQALNDPETTDVEIGEFLDKVDNEMDRFLRYQADVGAKQNRVELMEDRLAQQEIISTKVLSENEDVDIEKVIIELTTQESIHRAALSVGARIIQPSLLDFLR
ncbi:flagellar hook-associated protein FlgL [Bacillus kwashiorkori]|uniref:flagellar hook-associated protein FlgL n=1 Tax=Bacillus kwashiorkori TaxID=1522318 RepID=UPI0007816229|nr:flagellar hook-associated protein FlgL [Bacillus kwashiorkori]